MEAHAVNWWQREPHECQHLFEVITYYKSGIRRKDMIEADTQDKMWKYYFKHHNMKLVDECFIYGTCNKKVC